MFLHQIIIRLSSWYSFSSIPIQQIRYISNKTNNANIKITKIPLTGYRLFTKEKMGLFQGDVSQRSPKIATLWKSLSLQERKQYIDRAAIELKKYRLDTEKLSKEQKALLKAERLRIKNEKLNKNNRSNLKEETQFPKKPATVFALWLSENSCLFEGLKGRDRFKRQIEVYRSLPNEEKQIYKENFLKAQAEHKEKIMAWIKKYKYPENEDLDDQT